MQGFVNKPADIKEQLIAFLLKASKAGSAPSGESIWKKEEDGSTTSVHESGPFKMHDNFFGGEPFGGREVVFYENKPLWAMVYYGKAEVSDMKELYDFLQKALSEMPPEAPFRGPKNFHEGQYRYENQWEGDVLDFSGVERIYVDEAKVYSARYMGGLVDQRPD